MTIIRATICRFSAVEANTLKGMAAERNGLVYSGMRLAGVVYEILGRVSQTRRGEYARTAGSFDSSESEEHDVNRAFALSLLLR
jgi:hypothetical protein